ncbi:Nitrate/nitrite transporter NarK [Streptoalloteichus hindustanus]|uniref:Nitrate/nitrite transporter NarK n=2 Tax=Streptoalloteichus hindustanus TaxID=2017 RepID=A0A1M5DFG1_STRHI|nr:Nitrate/nitrite transporter NarK [Streptoalloteichus hindustanus]
MMTASGWSANQFSALLDTYRSGLGLTESTVTGLVAVYVLGLVPGLLAGGPLADRVGRRPVALAALAINLASTAVLMLGSSAAWLLLPGRLLTGIGAGALLAAGSAWVKELSAPPFAEEARPGTAARRAGLFVSAGFASGGLVASLIAQWTPSPLVTGYLPHLLLAGAALVLARPAPETRSARPTGPARPAHVTDWRRFRRAVLPLAPWVFAAPSIGFVTLPGLVRGIGDLRTVYAGVATAVVPAAGLLIQPLARHLATRYRLTAAASGPAVVALGFLLAAPAAADGGPVLSLVAAAVFGAGYGLLLAFCLTEVAAVAPPHHLARVTSLFWTAAYLGMFAPYAVTLLSGAFAVSTLMIAGAALAVLTCVAVPALARSASR